MITTIFIFIERKSNFFKNFIFFNFILVSIFLSFKLHSGPEYDELAHLSHVNEIFNSKNYWYLGDRNRMPLFNYLLFIFFKLDFLELDFYRIGQLANIFCTSFITYIFINKIKPMFNSNLVYLVCTTLILFIPILSYIHFLVVESLFFSIFGLFMYKALEVQDNRSARNILLLGVFGAFMYLTKATGLFIFLITLFCIVIFDLFNSKKIDFKLLSISTLIFLVVCSPYLYENFKNFDGKIFYNVNTTYYIWYDSWEEVESGTKYFGDRVGIPKMNKNDIPSFQNYISEHSSEEIIKRFSDGFNVIFKKYSDVSQISGIAIYSLFYLLAILFFKERKILSRINNKFKFLLFYTMVLVFSILISSSWYMYIATGLRFTIYLFIPLYLCTLSIYDKSIDINNSDRFKDYIFLLFCIFFVGTSSILYLL